MLILYKHCTLSLLTFNLYDPKLITMEVTARAKPQVLVLSGLVVVVFNFNTMN